MISNFQNIMQQANQKQLNTCLHKSMDSNSSSVLNPKIYSQSCLESTATRMSTITTSVAAAAANKESLVKPPMEAVVVNSIIYSKPSFCRISVDFGDLPTDKKATTETTLTTGSCPSDITCFGQTICPAMDLKNASSNFNAASCLADLAASPSLDVDEDTKLYSMCTTLNGSIHHQISGLCDNIFAMAGFYGVANNEHDDDSFIEFAYEDDADDDDDDEDEDEDDDSDEHDFIDDDDEDDCDYEVDDDNDVVDFSYEDPIEPALKLNCDRKKKVRFNTTPTVHKMHTWTYAYRAARKGEWEMYARDRERFKLRTQRTALTLNPILEREHRQKIFEKRFANLYNEFDGQNEISAQKMESKKTYTNTESKNQHQKKKRKKRRFCKMGNKHYF